MRVWLLSPAAWIMGWAVYLILVGIRGKFQTSRDLLAIPVLLIGRPIAFLLFGSATGWAFRDFKPDNGETGPWKRSICERGN